MEKLQKLKSQLLQTWVPLWNNSFIDNKYGGYHERIDNNLQPINTDEKRLHSQCRQIYTYSHAIIEGSDKSIMPSLHDSVEFLVNNFQGAEKGSWISSTNNHGDPKDKNIDLYRVSFVILSMIFYYKLTKDSEALKHAKNTILFIQKHFKHKNKIGYYEELTPEFKPIIKIRRQNPHMHLLEACLFAYEETNDAIYIETAHNLYKLFTEHFFNDNKKCLIEYFNEELEPDNTISNDIESGHHFEWVWLLDKYKRTSNINNDRYQKQLYDFAIKNCINLNNNHIYYTLNNNCKITNSQHRAWTMFEMLKANPIMNNDNTNTISTINDYVQSNGKWIEIFDKDLVCQTDYMPSTTPYHITMGILETAKYLDK